MHDAGADIGAADIDAENGFVRLEHPFRREMHGADQAGFVRIVADRDEVDLDAVGFQDHRGAADHEFADAAGAEAAADHDALGVLPALQLEEAADDERQFLREILDRAMHDAGGFAVALGEEFVELLLGQVVARLVAERVGAGLAQGLSPILDDVAERALAGAVADEALVVLDLDIVAVDLDRRQAQRAMRGDGGKRLLLGLLLGHGPFSEPG